MKLVSTLLVATLAAGAVAAQAPAPPPVDSLHRPFDEILDPRLRGRGGHRRSRGAAEVMPAETALTAGEIMDADDPAAAER